jgi:hypothetical protein
MKQNKIENQIRKTFQEREIKPSPMAWDRLDAMLTVAEQPKKRSVFKIWHYAAALFFVATMTWIVTILFNQKQIVELPVQEVVIQKEAQTQKLDSSNSVVLETETGLKTKQNPIAVSDINQPRKAAKSIVITNQNSNSEVADLSQILANRHPINQEEKLVLTPRAAQLLAAVENTKIDQNLKNETKLIEISSVNVDAQSLLEVSEKEVNQSFRNKVIRNVNKVSTALVNRNLE